MTIIASMIMLSKHNIKNNTFKLVIGLFVSVIIYYINNYFNVLGKTEKLTVLASIWIPILVLTLFSIIFARKVNVS